MGPCGIDKDVLLTGRLWRMGADKLELLASIVDAFVCMGKQASFA